MARKDKIERNAELVQRYASGEAAEALCAAFKISRARLYQILKEAGVPKERYGNNIRDEFLGVNLAGDVKDALRAEAARRGISMSMLSSELLRDMLLCCGYPVEASKVE
jgi:hypothetical protein